MARINKNAFLCISFIFICILAACSNTTSNPTSQASNEQPLIIKQDTDRFEYTKPGDFCSAILTAEVRVDKQGKSYWNTVDGKKPHETDKQVILQKGYRVYTGVTFSQFAALKDQRKTKTNTYVTMGGTVGQDQMWMDAFPQAEDSQHYLAVFSPSVKPGEADLSEETLILYGLYPIDAQDIITLQSGTSKKEAGVGKPAAPLTISLKDFKQEISTCK